MGKPFKLFSSSYLRCFNIRKLPLLENYNKIFTNNKTFSNLCQRNSLTVRFRLWSMQKFTRKHQLQLDLCFSTVKNASSLNLLKITNVSRFKFLHLKVIFQCSLHRPKGLINRARLLLNSGEFLTLSFLFIVQGY